MIDIGDFAPDIDLPDENERGTLSRARVLKAVPSLPRAGYPARRAITSVRHYLLSHMRDRQG
ncbi:MAG: hypothetical protein KAR37_18730 [Alphaproteobacteria bacterium]|jgi:hypothetical protein|nr:hypothetical protein [Alphaproteobacteria bacterium]